MRPETPEDDPHFDPEDDRAEYLGGAEETAGTLADLYFSEIWPESAGR